MRRVSTRANAIVGYLGRIAGAGSVRIGGETVARAAYDFDGFAAPRGGVMGSGELKLAPCDSKPCLAGSPFNSSTDDGRLLDLTFSEKELAPATDAAHVDVSGDLPRSPAEWRAGSAREPIRSGHGAGKSTGNDGASPSIRRRRSRNLIWKEQEDPAPGTQHASPGRARRELGNEGILSATDALFVAGLTSSTRSGTQAELFGALMCDAAKYASHSLDDRLSMEAPVLHFDLQSLHQIKDTERHSWATVRADDGTTFSELARCGFHLIDMRGETWTMHRE